MEFLARPGDTLVALHVIVGKEEQKNGLGVIRFRRAKASVISILADFAELSQRKTEAKVTRNTSIGKGLAEEATALDASFLLVGGSRTSQSLKYCFKHIPESCSMVSMGKIAQPCWQPAVSESFESKVDGEKTSCASLSSCEDSSPASVLDVAEVSRSLSISYNGGISRTAIWRRLSIVKLFFPLFHAVNDLHGKEMDKDCSPDHTEQKPSWRCFSYDEIANATNSFHPDSIVGRGGYSEVFKGTLCNGVDIAVKRLSRSNRDDKEKDFLAELGILGHVYHPNTSNIIGCCFENGFHLIFDFCPNGNLASALHGRSSKLLEWRDRYNIAVGVARGLHYLHKGCRRRVIHRDIKASNVLLRSDYEPQISDFGLAKWLPRQLNHLSIIPIEGTFGYLAPEYFMHGLVDEKTDVFAFGVLLLELVTGKRPVDPSYQSLLVWAKPRIAAGKFTEFADPKLGGKYDKEQLQRLVLVASFCVRPSPIWRPTMNEVLHLLSDGNDLKGAVTWKMPKSQIDGCDAFCTKSEMYFVT
ncbi:hypothetical protein HPP92_002618 [Vanilla planifolia]|uniref:Protein kinase domain-containing protein n=1 Tax=Vanilla planifolia TaxID=51239 RepID=A0A835SA41_VANPL|nr:hypothetical protein HPP92_002618 [Vanilla planifolia]